MLAPISTHAIRSSAEWAGYFRDNLADEPAIPWERGAEITAAELIAIGKSLQGWQLGETSDGRHLRAAAMGYAERISDPDYVAAIDLFIREEQRHGEMLGRFLDLAGLGRVQFNWGDCLFRIARYFMTNMEIWTTPVLMVETLAVVYYNAIRRATRSTVLQAICSRILADEIPHLQFQCERLAVIFRTRPQWALHLTLLGHRAAFLGVMSLVWIGHRRALRAGGYHWRRYWRSGWDRMARCWRIIEANLCRCSHKP
jgi:hypothetical protein